MPTGTRRGALVCRPIHEIKILGGQLGWTPPQSLRPVAVRAYDAARPAAVVAGSSEELHIHTFHMLDMINALKLTSVNIICIHERIKVSCLRYR